MPILGETKMWWYQVNRRTASGSFVAGILAFCMFCWSFFCQASFYSDSRQFSGTVVAVSYEAVPRGRGSAMAYVPIVKVNEFGEGTTIKADVSDESPVYAIGALIPLRCSHDSPPLCREDKILSLWAGSLIWFLITIVFLVLGLIFRWESF